MRSAVGRYGKRPRLAIKYRLYFTMPHLSTAAVPTLGRLRCRRHADANRPTVGIMAMVAEEEEGRMISARTKVALAAASAARCWAGIMGASQLRRCANSLQRPATSVRHRGQPITPTISGSGGGREPGRHGR